MAPRSDYVKSYRSRQSVGLGATLIISGLLSMAFNAVGLAVGDDLAIVGHGFWCGAMFIVTGGCGIGAKHKHRCMITAFMIMCIFSAIITLCLLGFGIGGAGQYSSYCNYYGSQCNRTGTVMEALQAVLAFATAIVSIWGSANCCRAVCCCAKVDVQHLNLATTNANQYTAEVSLAERQRQRRQLERHSLATPVVTSPAQPVFDPPPYYQPSSPQQWTGTSQTQQPFTPAVCGPGPPLDPSAPEYGPIGTPLPPPPSYDEAMTNNN